MLACKDCKHCSYNQGWKLFKILDNSRCLKTPFYVDPLSGKKYYAYCFRRREYGGGCNPKGEWWEANESSH